MLTNHSECLPFAVFSYIYHYMGNVVIHVSLLDEGGG